MVPGTPEERPRPADPEATGVSHALGTLVAWGVALLPLWIGIGAGVLPQAALLGVGVAAAIALGLCAKLLAPEDTFMTLFPIAVVASLFLKLFG
ncbi:MAG: hypothetical protein AB7N76_29760 [Planctomycetota bacterium]